MKRFEFIAEAIKGLENPLGAEIGVADGITSLYLLQNNPTIEMVCVDPYTMYQRLYADGINAQHAHKTQEGFDAQYQAVAQKLAPFGSRAKLIRETSESASHYFMDHQLDFVFIDGNHLYDAVKADIVRWWPKIKNGGILFGHDYNLADANLIDNVCRAVDEFFSEKEFNLGPDYLWYVIKEDE